MGGVMSLPGEPDGTPQKVGIPIADLFAGLYGCIGIHAALRQSGIDRGRRTVSHRRIVHFASKGRTSPR
jgi:crotonobetainyl-CoA:carnitine CoA-transferase CaiB-like acyl-CoA transferase